MILSLFEKNDLAASRNTVEALSSSHLATTTSNVASRIVHVLGSRRIVIPFLFALQKKKRMNENERIKARISFVEKFYTRFSFEESFTLNGISIDDVVELF